MFEFKRGIKQAFVDRLNLEYERESANGGKGWWTSVADDASLFVAIRHNYLSVYAAGNCLLEVRYVDNELIGRTNYKYLLKPDVEPPQVSFFLGKQPPIKNPSQFFVDDISNIALLKRAAKPYSGDEKLGVHQIVTSNPNILDVEITFGLAHEASHQKATKRIDFAAIQEGRHGPELVFFEAKCFVNPELRASQSTAAPVVRQIQGYRALLQQHREHLAASYATIVNNLHSLRGTAIQKRAGALPKVDPKQLHVNHDVRLVVFGYDTDQEKGAVWQTHLKKLNEIKVLSRGSAKGFTRGISSDYIKA